MYFLICVIGIIIFVIALCLPSSSTTTKPTDESLTKKNILDDIDPQGYYRDNGICPFCQGLGADPDTYSQLYGQGGSNTCSVCQGTGKYTED